MKTRPTTPLTAAQREALEARFALRLSARLDEGAQTVPHDIGERLRVARAQAVEAARHKRLKLATQPVAVHTPVAVEVSLTGLQPAGAGGVGGMGNWSEGSQLRAPGHGRRLDDGPVSWGWRLASALPVLALLAGLWGVHRYHQLEKVHAAADVDTALLSDDLPPDAYSDPGFTEFLRTETAPATEVEAIAQPSIEATEQPPIPMDATADLPAPATLN